MARSGDTVVDGDEAQQLDDESKKRKSDGTDTTTASTEPTTTTKKTKKEDTVDQQQQPEDNVDSVKKMSARTVISTPNAPSAIGPYSQAIKANGQVWVSGCLGFDKDTMDFVDKECVEAQTQRALENMTAILEAAGSSMAKVVKTTILLKDMNDFAKVNKVYATFFAVDPPARSTFAVRELPRAALVEIEAIALE
eukprot:gene1173-1346_t